MTILSIRKNIEGVELSCMAGVKCFGKLLRLLHKIKHTHLFTVEKKRFEKVYFPGILSRKKWLGYALHVNEEIILKSKRHRFKQIKIILFNPGSNKKYRNIATSLNLIRLYKSKKQEKLESL